MSSSPSPHPGVAPVLADPRCSLEVREHQHVKELGPRGRPEGVEPLAEQLLHLGDCTRETLPQHADLAQTLPIGPLRLPINPGRPIRESSPPASGLNDLTLTWAV
jgi:hypothetical protein